MGCLFFLCFEFGLVPVRKRAGNPMHSMQVLLEQVDNLLYNKYDRHHVKRWIAGERAGLAFVRSKKYVRRTEAQAGLRKAVRAGCKKMLKDSCPCKTGFVRLGKEMTGVVWKMRRA